GAASGRAWVRRRALAGRRRAAGGSAAEHLRGLERAGRARRHRPARGRCPEPGRASTRGSRHRPPDHLDEDVLIPAGSHPVDLLLTNQPDGDIMIGMSTRRMPAHLVEFAEGIDDFGGDSLALHEDDIEEMWFLGMVPDEVADAQVAGE